MIRIDIFDALRVRSTKAIGSADDRRGIAGVPVRHLDLGTIPVGSHRSEVKLAQGVGPVGPEAVGAAARRARSTSATFSASWQVGSTTRATQTSCFALIDRGGACAA